MDAEELYRRPRLRDDALQWELDRAIKETGRAQHFFSDRALPESVRMHAMIAKHLALPARRAEKLANAEEAAGHSLTAIDLYYQAAHAFSEAQHVIFSNNDEKRMLYDASVRCYDGVRRLSPNVIEHLEIPWEGKSVSGYLHLAPVEGPAPLVFFVPGCDMTKEWLPHPRRNWAAERGMHLFAFDGPGQGASNLRDIVLTTDNYERAATTALSALLKRPEIDASRVAVYSQSFGSYWGARFAATDHRLSACVLQWASVADKRHLFDGGVSPRYRQQFAYFIRAETESDLDNFIAEMSLDDLAGEIECDTLVTVGEFDPRTPLEEALEFFDRLRAPAEMWVFSEKHHVVSLDVGNKLGIDSHNLAMDWIRDRFDGKPLTRVGDVLWLEADGISPYDPTASSRRSWFE